MEKGTRHGCAEQEFEARSPARVLFFGLAMGMVTKYCGFLNYLNVEINNQKASKI